MTPNRGGGDGKLRGLLRSTRAVGHWGVDASYVAKSTAASLKRLDVCSRGSRGGSRLGNIVLLDPGQRVDDIVVREVLQLRLDEV